MNAASLDSRLAEALDAPLHRPPGTAAGPWTVLVPTRRAAHALRTAYGLHAVAAGRRAWLTPTVLTFRTWVERAWLAREPVPGDEQLLTAAAGRVVWEQIVHRSDAGRHLLNPARAARAAAASWDRLQAFELGLGDVRRHIAATADATEESLAFLGWADAFERRCAERRWLPASRLPALLAAAPPQDVRLLLVLDGEPEDVLPPQHRRLLAALVTAGGTVRNHPTTVADGTALRFAAADERQELECAAAWARDQLAEGRRAVAVAIPNLERRAAEVQRIFLSALLPAAQVAGGSAAAAPFTVVAGRRLGDFPVVRTALALLEFAAEGGDAPTVGRLLRDPFVGGAAAEAGRRARADAQWRAEGFDRFSVRSLQRLAAVHECTLLAGPLQAVLALLASLEAMPRRPASVWTGWWPTLWQAFGWPGDRGADSVEQQAIGKLQSALADFGALDDVLGPMTLGVAIREFRRWVGETAFEPQTPEVPVQIVGSESLEAGFGGVRFEALWVCGLHGDRWPPAPDPDPLLPLRLQGRHGMPGATVATARRRAELAYARLEALAPVRVYSWPQVADETELLPSPMVAGLADYAALVTDPQARPAARLLARHLHAHRPELEILRDDDAPPPLPGRAPGGTRLLQLQSQCPFRAQAELRLASRRLEPYALGLDHRARGLLIHDALRGIWEALGSRERLDAIAGDATPGALATFVQQHLAAASAPLLGRVSGHRRRQVQIEVELATGRLLELLALERMRPPFVVAERPELRLAWQGAGLTLELSADRIDRLADGGEVVVDYKTGLSQKPSQWWGSRPLQPQLPLYAVARGEHVAAVTFAIIHAKGVAFNGVAKRGGLLPGVPEHPAGDKVPDAARDWAAMLAYWRQVVGGLMAGFAAGQAIVDPLPTVCQTCHLTTFCRIHQRG